MNRLFFSGYGDAGAAIRTTKSIVHVSAESCQRRKSGNFGQPKQADRSFLAARIPELQMAAFADGIKITTNIV
jgi:hypothetical protein